MVNRCYIFFILFMVLYLCIPSYTSIQLVTPNTLTNIVLDKATGNLYIGGINFLYKTNSDLVVISKNVTGPVPDSVWCDPPPTGGCLSNYKRIPTDNYNKILLIHDSKKQLLICGSVYWGVCELWDMNTLEKVAKGGKIASRYTDIPASGIIANGPHNEEVLYLATSWSYHAYKEMSYTDLAEITTRSLNPFKDFDLIIDRGKVSELKFKDPSFTVSYVYGFSSGKFMYFISVRESEESYLKKIDKVYETKISHICYKDETYVSYTEIPLKCISKNGTDFNIATSSFVAKPGTKLATKLGITTSSDVVFVTFSKSSAGSRKPSSESALCYYSVKEIEEMIENNVKKCYSNGNIPLGMPWVNDNTKCDKKDVANPASCPPLTSPSNHPIGGSISLSKQAIMEYKNLISVTALPYEEHTAVLIGDSTGNLLKVSIGDGISPVTPYYKKAVTPGEPIKKLVLNKDKLSVYAATNNKVIKLPIEECSSYSTCQSCTGRGDPFCGWCSLYRKCSRRALCANSAVHPLRFTTNVSECIEFTSIQPPRFPHGSVTQLEATIKSLPPATSGQTYKCSFNKIERTTTVFANGTIRCSTPPSSDLPSITSPSGDVMVQLSLYSSETGRLFVSTKVAFYNCTLMDGCTRCSESDYDCDWCTYQGKCYANGISYCPKSGEIVLSKKKRPADAVGCPYIEKDQPFLLPNKISKPIVLKAKNLPIIKYSYEYKCVLMVEDTSFEVDATRNNDNKLTCQPYKYSYTASKQYYTAKLKVLWRGKEVIQQPDTVTVSLYKCNVNRDDCSTCLVANPKLECGWCKADTLSSCQVNEACSQVWVHPSQSCNTVPVIKQFWPPTGPPQGGTEVEIDGIDFGKQFSDIQKSVTIANLTCIPDPDKYIVSKKIVCNTTQSARDVKGTVKVDVNSFVGVSKELFSYQTPKIEDFHPKKGPASGGSSVNITGIKLDTGRNIMAWLGSTPCIVDRTKITNVSIPCVTQATSLRSRRAVSNESTPTSLSGDVIVSFDGYRPPSPSVKFEFTADPVFIRIQPDKTFPTGGLRMTITGKNLDSVQVPKIFFVKAADRSVVSKPEICTVISSTTMCCPSPNVTYFGVFPGSNNGTEVIVGFIMDNVQGLNNVTTLAITADPYFEPFGKVRIITENLVLILKGNNLDILQKDEVEVTIEGVPCNITSLDEKQLVCNAPKKSQLPKVKDGEYMVMVKAAFLIFNIGKVKYREMRVVPKFPMIYIYIGVAVGGFILLLVIICLVCAYRRKKRQQSKNIQEYEMRIDNLESKVAKECREAFAELQTDMTDWTSDLSTARMPFWDFRTYALHVLFPGVVDHPVLAMKSNLTPNWENGLRKFAQLIQNKDFLLIFVRTLEQQNNFNMKDRCNLASLLMVTLQAKMEYATEILKQLLCDLIRKSLAQSNPKLLLRRTESVAEKLLTNWLAFCMYNHLKEESGKPLFMLFMAIKGQIEKGPVDMLTGEARYSLSEDKLLRHAIEYEVLKVSVSQDDEPPIFVSLLDSDTITQAKNKILDVIHKHEPYSSRPKQQSYQLSWMSSDGVEKVLLDDDASSVIEGPWRRINTLGHYKVPNDAFLKLSTHHTHFYGSTSSDLQLHSIPRTTFKPFSYTPLSRSSKEDLLEEGGRVWHLVKQQDYAVEQEDKMLSEIYLTRLLATKGTLQKFVNGLFDAIFATNRSNPTTPIAVKFMFDLLDSHAQELNLSDPEVLHTWKNNSLPLRFWINIVKNPNFIFDVHKGSTVDSCLSVIAQLFMDACSTSEHRLGVDSPSNKLLYAKEIPSYKKRVESYYSDIRSQPAPSESELKNFFADLSVQYGRMFNSDVALKELFRYVLKYQDQLQEKLEECGFSKLASDLEYIAADIAEDD